MLYGLVEVGCGEAPEGCAVSSSPFVATRLEGFSLELDARPRVGQDGPMASSKMEMSPNLLEGLYNYVCIHHISCHTNTFICTCKL